MSAEKLFTGENTTLTVSELVYLELNMHSTQTVSSLRMRSIVRGKRKSEWGRGGGRYGEVVGGGGGDGGKGREDVGRGGKKKCRKGTPS